MAKAHRRALPPWKRPPSDGCLPRVVAGRWGFPYPGEFDILRALLRGGRHHEGITEEPVEESAAPRGAEEEAHEGPAARLERPPEVLGTRLVRSSGPRRAMHIAWRGPHCSPSSATQPRSIAISRSSTARSRWHASSGRAAACTWSSTPGLTSMCLQTSPSGKGGRRGSHRGGERRSGHRRQVATLGGRSVDKCLAPRPDPLVGNSRYLRYEQLEVPVADTCGQGPHLDERQVLGLEVLDREQLEDVPIAVAGRRPVSSQRPVDKPAGCVKSQGPFGGYFGHPILRLPGDAPCQQLADDRQELGNREGRNTAILVERPHRGHEKYLLQTLYCVKYDLYKNNELSPASLARY